MKIQSILIITLLLLAGTNIFVYSNNSSLKQDISDKHNLCNDWLAKLAERAQPNPHTTFKTQTIHLTSNSTSVAPDTPDEVPEETNLENLVSYSHRMQAVSHKYEFLILSAQIKKDEKKLLKRLLLQRERLSNLLIVAEQEEQQEDIEEIEDNLYQVEDQIELVLNDPLDYYRYELIKQSQL